MNMNQIINMIMRMVMRRAVNFGVNAGISAISGAGRKRAQGNASGVDDFGNTSSSQTAQLSPEERLQQQQASQTAQRARQMAKATRRITKI